MTIIIIASRLLIVAAYNTVSSLACTVAPLTIISLLSNSNYSPDEIKLVDLCRSENFDVDEKNDDG